jgi:hypothetical protein
MTKYLTIALVLLACARSTAQSSRNDTIRLSVYNTGLVFDLSKAEFGGAVTQTLVAEMVRSYDTIIVRKDVGRDSSNRQKVRYTVERDCNKMTADLKDKIAVMELNRDCDVTLTCLKVQRAGAKALVIIHNSNSNGNIKLPKQGLYKDSIRIPIFTVGKDKGANITALLPTYVGIRIPSIQPLSTRTDTTQNPTTVQADKTNPNGLNPTDSELNPERTAEQNNLQRRNGWFLSPNPTSSYAQLDYGFSQPVDINITIFNDAGQLMQSHQQKATTNGSLSLDVSQWASGTYTLRLQNGKERTIKRLVVQH